MSNKRNWLIGNGETGSKLYLYRYGDECLDITGGWGITYQSSCTVTKEIDHISWVVSNGTMQQGWIYPVNKIDFSQYHMLHIDFEDYITNRNTSEFILWATSSRNASPYNDSSVVTNLLRTNQGSNGNYYKYKRNYDFTVENMKEFHTNYSWVTLDLSELEEPYYFGVGHYSDYSQTGYANIYEIWLE